ncbi:hypothetical protein D3C71_1788660 [compost metagenome]
MALRVREVRAACDPGGFSFTFVACGLSFIHVVLPWPVNIIFASSCPLFGKERILQRCRQQLFTATVASVFVTTTLLLHKRQL